MKLPLRERILNAYAGGFAPRWIAERFGVSLAVVHAALKTARRNGDGRARKASKSLAQMRRRMTIRIRDVENSPHAHLDVPDEFHYLPGIYEPILPFGGRIPQSVEDAP